MCVRERDREEDEEETTQQITRITITTTHYGNPFSREIHFFLNSFGRVMLMTFRSKIFIHKTKKDLFFPFN